MKILHAYPQNSSLIAHYVSIITAAMGTHVENRTVENASEASRQCREWKPDIVHVHGNLGYQLPRHQRLAVTPHGADVNLKAYVIIARSPMEQQRLKEMGHQRIEVVRNPIITQTTTPQKAARQLLEIYQRIIDSNVLELMDEQTHEMLRTLIKAGITNDRRWVESRKTSTEVNWRLLFIYAYQEGIDDLLQQGITALGIKTPAFDAASIKTYLPDGYTLPQPTDSDQLHLLLDSIGEEIGKKQFALCRLTQLHQLLMRGDIDEEKLIADLDTKHLLLLKRLLQVACTETLLDEGFMPVDPIDDRQTRLIRSLIYRHLEI